jgi:hypothetical protein
MTPAYSPQGIQAPSPKSVFFEGINRVLGTRWLKAAGRRQIGGQERAVKQDKPDSQMLHARLRSWLASLSNSSCRSQKGAFIAGGWQKTTRLSDGGRRRQIVRRRLFRRLRCTALPSLFWTTKTAPDASLAGRTHRQFPLIQPVGTLFSRLNSQALAPPAPAAVEHSAASRRAHALAKAVLVAALSIAWLKSALHDKCLLKVS